MSAKPPIVSNPDEITRDWLTSVLSHAGIDGRVTDFEAESVGTGQVGENVRFTLAGDNVPTSVVGKFPSTDEVSRQTGIQQGNYLREVFFYNEIRETVDIRTPRVLFADADVETHDFVIVMEDLAPGRQGDQMAGCSVDEAALALEELAKLQGPRWGDSSLMRYELLGLSFGPEHGAMLQAFYQSVAPGFLDRYAARLTDEQIAMTEKLGTRLDRYHDAYKGSPGLIHIDYRLDNMMFGGPYPLAVVDWQSVSVGCPVADASYFLGTSLDPEIRRSEERPLLRHYLDVLKSYKVDLTLDDCLAAYRNYAPAGLIMAVIASMIVGETDRGNDMFMAMATRSCQMCEDHELF